MLPFGENFSRSQPEKSPDRLLSDILYEKSSPPEETIQKIVSLEMVPTVENFIDRSVDLASVVKLMGFFVEEGKLAYLRTVVNKNLKIWVKTFESQVKDILSLFDSQNIELNVDSMTEEIDEIISKELKKPPERLHFLRLSSLIGMAKKYHIPINFDQIKVNQVDIGTAVQKALKVRQVSGIKELIEVLTDIGLNINIEKYLDSIKEGIDYSFEEDSYDKRFIRGFIQTLELVKGTKIEQEVKDYLSEKLNPEDGAWRMGTSKEGRQVFLERVLGLK